MATKVYINGEIHDGTDAKISVFDHCFLYGDGVFEGIRVYGGKIFKLDEHFQRLYRSANAICLKIPMSRDELAEAMQKTVKAAGISNGYIRLVVSRGAGDLGLDPRKCTKPSVVIIAAELQLYPEELYLNGLEIITGGTIRNHPEAINPRIKSCNYLNNILAKIEGINAGVEEVLMLNHQGFVAECTGDNIFAVQGDVQKAAVLTPPETEGVLKGVTRDVAMELAKKEGYEVVEKRISRLDLYNADEVFLTGTAAEIIAVVKIDGRTIGSGKQGPVTELLRKKFKELVEAAG